MRLSFASVAFIVVMATLPAHAQTRDENIAKCYDADDTELDHPDVVIDACTALIESGQESAATLSDIFVNRGDAYDNKNLVDQAIADWRAALKLNPHNGAAGIGLAIKGVTP